MTPKEERAYQLRLSGKTFKEIAQELNYADPSGAFLAYQRAQAIVSLENLTDWRNLELYRLDALHHSLWYRALGGDIRSVNALLKIFDIRAKLIGLYAPHKIEIEAQSDEPDVGEAVREMAEIINYGILYVQERGIENDYTRRKAIKEKEAAQNRTYLGGQ